MTESLEHLTLSRRAFLTSAAVAGGALLVAGGQAGMVATAHAQSVPATTFTQILEAAPASLDGAGSPPGLLLALAQQRSLAPEQLADSVAPEAGVPARQYPQLIDNEFPFATPFGQQPLGTRQAALAWATGDREDLPDLGPRRSSPPPRDPDAPDEGWRALAVAALGYAASLSAELTASRLPN